MILIRIFENKEATVSVSSLPEQVEATFGVFSLEFKRYQDLVSKAISSRRWNELENKF